MQRSKTIESWTVTAAGTFPAAWPCADLHLGCVYMAGSLRGLVRQLSIDQFENEGRRVSTGSVDPAARAGRSPLNLGLDRKSFSLGIHKVAPHACSSV